MKTKEKIFQIKQELTEMWAREENLAEEVARLGQIVLNERERVYEERRELNDKKQMVNDMLDKHIKYFENLCFRDLEMNTAIKQNQSSERNEVDLLKDFFAFAQEQDLLRERIFQTEQELAEMGVRAEMQAKVGARLKQIILNERARGYEERRALNDMKQMVNDMLDKRIKYFENVCLRDLDTKSQNKDINIDISLDDDPYMANQHEGEENPRNNNGSPSLTPIGIDLNPVLTGTQNNNMNIDMNFFTAPTDIYPDRQNTQQGQRNRLFSIFNPFNWSWGDSN